MENLFCEKGEGKSSSEEGLGNVDGISIEGGHHDGRRYTILE